MKKLLTTGILLATLFATVPNFANATTKSGLIPLDEGKMALTLKDVNPGNQLSIKDDNGIILYKELIKTSGTYKKGFDLTALPDGDYFFELEKDLEIRTIPFTVKSNKVVFNKEEATSIYKPFVRQKDDKVFITKLALNGEPLKISIYSGENGDYKLAYTETIEGVKTIGKAYTLKKGGTYKITLNSNNKEYTTFINN